jgi:MoaA/NifB/PqqE/SkfB family radical SAM enzyme
MADKYLMDGNKLMWHKGRVVDWLNGKRIAPLYIDMGITKTCNIKCKYCYYSVPENRTMEIFPTDKLTAFLRDAASIGVKAIGFLGDGEPMLHPGVYEAVISGAEAGLDMALSSNGLILKEKGLDRFLASLTWIRFNISASPEKYTSIMGTWAGNFDRVMGNIRKCVEVKRKNNLKTTIGLQMVLIEECAEDIVPFAKLGKELGVDYAVIKQCSESHVHKLNLADEDYDKYTHLLREAESFSGSDYNVIIKWRKMRSRGIRNYDHCYGCEFLPQISGNGKVYNCGNFFGNEAFCCGDLTKEAFRDIVFGERYKEVMDKVKSKVDVHTVCGINCRQNEINEFLWSLKKYKIELDDPIGQPPEHINFV